MHSPLDPAAPAVHDSGSGEARTTSKAIPLTFCTLGVAGSALGIGWAMLVWHYDQLITPRGQVIVTITSAAVMSLFIGVLAYWRAGDRDRKLALHKAQMSEIAGLRAEMRALRAEVEEFRTESVSDKVKLRDDILSAIKGHQDGVHVEHVELNKQILRVTSGQRDLIATVAGVQAELTHEREAARARELTAYLTGLEDRRDGGPPVA